MDVLIKNKKCIQIFMHVNSSGFESDKYKNVRLNLRGESIWVRLHVLNFWVSQDFPTPYDKLLDCSHLCHVPSCVKLSHLNLESRSINHARKACLKNGICSGHEGHPNCIF